MMGPEMTNGSHGMIMGGSHGMMDGMAATVPGTSRPATDRQSWLAGEGDGATWAHLPSSDDGPHPCPHPASSAHACVAFPDGR